MNIYIGNLSYNITEEDLRQAFETFGQIASVSIIKDKFSGQSKGFGFIEMPVKEEAESAISGMNGKLVDRNGHNAHSYEAFDEHLIFQDKIS